MRVTRSTAAPPMKRMPRSAKARSTSAAVRAPALRDRTAAASSQTAIDARRLAAQARRQREGDLAAAGAGAHHDDAPAARPRVRQRAPRRCAAIAVSIGFKPTSGR